MIDKTRLQAVFHSKKITKYGLRVLVALALVGVLGFFVLPPIVKSILIDKLGEALHRQITVENVSINPYDLSVSLDGVAIQEGDGGGIFASFDRLYLNLESSSILRFGPVLGEVRLVNPKLRVVRLSGNRYNFSDLVDEFMAKPKSNDPVLPFSVSNVQLTGGVVEFDDRPVGAKHVVSEITLTLPFISSMAYATESFVEPVFSAHINGAPLIIKGKSKPFANSLESEMALDLDNLELAKYIEYVPFKLPIKVLSGALDTNLKLVFRQEMGKPSSLMLSGTTMIKSVNVRELPGVPLVAFKHLELAIGSVDVLNHKVVIDRFVVDSPEIYARVSRQGDFNWIGLFRKGLSADKPAPQNPEKVEFGIPFEWSLGEAKVTGGALRWLDESNGQPFKASIEAMEFGLRNLGNTANTLAEFDFGCRVIAEEWFKMESFSARNGKLDLAKHEVLIDDVLARGVRGLVRRAADGHIEWLKPPVLRAVEASPKETSVPWKISVTKYVGDDIGVRFEDRAVSPMAIQRIDGFGFEVTNLSNNPAQAAKLAARFKFNRRGDVAINGSLKPFPFDANLNLDVRTLELLPLQPYFSEKLNIDVTRGQVMVKGAVQLRQSEASGVSGGFSGQATVADFYAVDKINSADFLRWKSFYFGKVDVRLNPDSITIGDVALSDFFARVIVSPEGKLNLLQIVRKNALVTDVVAPLASAQPVNPPSTEGKATSPVVVESKPLMPIKIGKITLQGGSVRFTDNFVKPNYTANLKEVGGQITGLSSEPGTIANLELRGSYDNVAPLSVTATINPLSAKPYLDLQAEIKGVELTSFSSYSGKYAGYGIEKGKLSLFVKYKIENDQLAAENRVFLDQLTFGDAVDSPDATKLPVRLAVALLKNRNGEIDLELPISGSLSDPQFSIGGLVVKVIVNLLTKAVTSPFALIGSMFGSDEELSNVEFDYGHAAITLAARTRLENLAKALIDRPSLKLEIEGRVDSERDREGLKSARISHKVRALKREDLTKNGVESGSAETVDVTAQEYPALLERVYRTEKFPKPRNMVGLVKGLPVEEMEKLMLTNSTVNDDDLHDLGERRAKAVRDWLVAHGVPVERVFILGEVRMEGKPDQAQKTKGNRADFTLK